MKIIFNGKLPEDRHPKLVCDICDTTVQCESSSEYGTVRDHRWYCGSYIRFTVNCPVCKKTQPARLYETDYG